MIQATKLIDGEIAYENGRRVILYGRDAIAQRIRNAIVMFLGEFVLTPSRGIDWFTLTEVGIGLPRIQSAVTAKITEDPDVIRISSFSIERGAESSVIISFVAQTTEGTVSIAGEI